MKKFDRYNNFYFDQISNHQCLGIYETHQTQNESNLNNTCKSESNYKKKKNKIICRRKNENYFFARYDGKTDQCLGVYETIEEALWKVYGYDKNHPKYKIAKNSIIASYSNASRPDGYRRSAHGIWYKYPK